MDEHTKAKDKLEDMFASEPRPISAERAVEIASLHLDSVKLTQFKTWFEHNGTALVERLNG